jgi:hypothetical protein
LDKAVELKIGELKPNYAGKMQFYLTDLDDFVKLLGGESLYRYYYL